VRLRFILGNLVSLVRSLSPKEINKSICKTFDLIGFNIDKPVRQVAIKPNLCYYWDASTGYTTDPRIVSGVIDWVRDRLGVDTEIKIVESDATGMRTKLAFLILGYEKLAREKDVELVNLTDVPSIVEKVTVNKHEYDFKVPLLLKEADLFINVPKLKIMRISRITCAMKNIFGCISSPRKIVYHPRISEAIVGINKILKPHVTLVDGIVGLGRYPIKLDLIMASKDVFSLDWVASEIMGYSPSEIDFLNLSRKEGLGESQGIQTVGEDPKDIRKIFPKAGRLSTEYLWSLQIGLLKTYAKIVDDIIPPFVQE